MVLLAFTRIPFDAHRRLATAAGICSGRVEMLVVLGGSGMPSGPELLRLHHAAVLAADLPAARVLVVHPSETATMDAMVQELVLKGVDRARIAVLMSGTNTRAQALEVAELWTKDSRGMAAVVTAPENMYRTLRAFRKAGTGAVCGHPAYDHAMFIDLDYDHLKLGGRTILPDVSSEPGIRYTFWNYLKLEITCLREYVAIAYYWLNGWV